MALPQLTDEQRKQALEKAAAARHARAELREQIKNCLLYTSPSPRDCS